MSEPVQGFDGGWLAMREPLDRAARDAGLTAALVDWIDARRAASGAAAVHLVDLGCGSGSNLRHLLPRLGMGQRWRLIDNDPVLLGSLPVLLDAWCRQRELTLGVAADRSLKVRGDGVSATITVERVDLAAGLEGLDLGGADLVTASALLDLCSGNWIGALVKACADARAAGLFVLDYDGTADWTPPMEMDARVRELVNRHQRRDKGFGPALGPAAGAFAAERFADAGYEVSAARSVWRIDADAAVLHAAFVDGWAGAATELESGDADTGAAIAAIAAIAEWAAARRERIETGAVALAVGHHDVLALPG